MKKPFLAVTLIALLSGCIGDMYVTSTTVITSKPSYVQRQLPQTENVLMCPNQQLSSELFEQGTVSSWCVMNDVAGESVFSWHYDHQPPYTVMTQGVGYRQYFWPVPGIVRNYTKQW